MNASSIAICPPRFLPGRLTRARVPFRPLLVVAFPHNNNALSACVTPAIITGNSKPASKRTWQAQQTRKKFRVAVSGNTVDGREIQPQHLRDAAANYNPEVYGARVNIEHYLSVP
jgi:hypothetical protein